MLRFRQVKHDQGGRRAEMPGRIPSAQSTIVWTVPYLTRGEMSYSTHGTLLLAAARKIVIVEFAKILRYIFINHRAKRTPPQFTGDRSPRRDAYED